MKKICLYLLLIVSLLLSACASKSAYIAEQKPWIGSHVAKYMQKFGYPENIININSTTKAYIYKKMISDPGSEFRAGTSYNTLMYMNSNPNFYNMYSLNCTTWVVVDDKTHIILNITFKGNYCVKNTDPF